MPPNGTRKMKLFQHLMQTPSIREFSFKYKTWLFRFWLDLNLYKLILGVKQHCDVHSLPEYHNWIHKLGQCPLYDLLGQSDQFNTFSDDRDDYVKLIPYDCK